MAYLENRGLTVGGEQMWRAVTTIGGQRRAYSFHLPSKRAAEREAARWEAEQRAAHVPARRSAIPQTMDDLGARWLEHQETRVSPTTLARDRGSWSTWISPAVGKINPQALSATDLNALYEQMRLARRSPATIRKVHNAISGALRSAEKWGWAPRNVARLADPPTVSAPRIVLPPMSDIARVIAAIRDPLIRDVCRVLGETGARRGEVLAITWGDVDLDAGTLCIDEAVIGLKGGKRLVKETKTKIVRTIAIGPALVELFARRRAQWEDLGAVLDPSWPVFAWAPGEPCIPPATVSHAWARTAAECGVKLHLHGLRHNNATMLLDAGLSVAEVAKRTGHSDGGNTLLRRYASGTERADRRAADIAEALFSGE